MTKYCKRATITSSSHHGMIDADSLLIIPISAVSAPDLQISLFLSLSATPITYRSLELNISIAIKLHGGTYFPCDYTNNWKYTGNEHY